MKLNKMFLTLMVALIAVLELKNEGTNASVFDTHSVTMVIFCVIFVIYGILLLADELVHQPNENDYGGIMSKAILCAGSLGVVLLFLMILPVLGWSLLVLWVVSIAKVFFEELYVILRLSLLYRFLQAIHTFCWEMPRRCTLVRQQNRIPV